MCGYKNNRLVVVCMYVWYQINVFLILSLIMSISAWSKFIVAPRAMQSAYAQTKTPQSYPFSCWGMSFRQHFVHSFSLNISSFRLDSSPRYRRIFAQHPRSDFPSESWFSSGQSLHVWDTSVYNSLNWYVLVSKRVRIWRYQFDEWSWTLCCVLSLYRECKNSCWL